MALKVNEIIALALAGFNASQIAALNTVNAAPAAPAPAAPAPAPAPAPAAPAPAPAAPAPAPADPLSQILAQLQQNAINASQQPKVQTADEILAEIINPTIKEGK